MEQQRIAASIYHDLDKNLYYRINKNTGQVTRAYKNGSPLRNFQVDVTGNDYKNRKSTEGNNNQPSPPKQRFKMKLDCLHNKRSSPMKSQHILNRYHMEYRKEDSRPNRRSAARNDSRSLNHSSFIVKSQMSQHQDKLLTIAEPHQSTIQRHQSNLGPILQKFTSLNTKKVYDNHSNLHKNSGIVINPRHSLQNGGFRQSKNTFYKQAGRPVEKPLKQKTIVHLDQKQIRQYMTRQLSKEKKLFLQFNPNFEERQNLRLLNQQVQRKKNIKKLEQLFLEQTSKVTNQIYK